MAVARVQHRVRMGGHRVPVNVIRRRYEQGWLNFGNTYKALVSSWQIYDATRSPPVMIDEGGEA